jgi:hypothetical protein
MLSWGVVVFIGLWLVFRDVNPVTKAKLLGNPMLIHVIVIGSGLWIHGGSADGAMAAIVSGVFSALTCASTSGGTATSVRTSGIPACYVRGIRDKE